MSAVCRLFTVLAVYVLLLGCRVEVVNEKGGSVYTVVANQYVSINSCMEWQICIHEIDNTTFQASFYAEPKTGWFFSGWAGGEMSLCNGIQSNLCRVDLSLLDPNDAQAIIDTSETAYLRPTFKPVSENKTIVVRRREWYQPSLFAGLTWNEIADVCPEDYCSGSLNGHDVTGWTWATVNNVNRLFDYYLGDRTLGFGPDGVSFNEYEDFDSKTHTFFGGAGWAPNYSTSDAEMVPLLNTRLEGWTRNQRLRFPDEAWVGYIHQVRVTAGYTDDYSDIGTNRPKSIYSKGQGAWFYRNL